ALSSAAIREPTGPIAGAFMDISFVVAIVLVLMALFLPRRLFIGLDSSRPQGLMVRRAMVIVFMPSVRCDVLIEPEQIVRVVAGLERGQAGIGRGRICPP